MCILQNHENQFLPVFQLLIVFFRFSFLFLDCLTKCWLGVENVRWWWVRQFTFDYRHWILVLTWVKVLHRIKPMRSLEGVLWETGPQQLLESKSIIPLLVPRHKLCHTKTEGFSIKGLILNFHRQSPYLYLEGDDGWGCKHGRLKLSSGR